MQRVYSLSILTSQLFFATARRRLTVIVDRICADLAFAVLRTFFICLRIHSTSCCWLQYLVFNFVICNSWVLCDFRRWCLTWKESQSASKMNSKFLSKTGKEWAETGLFRYSRCYRLL